MQIQGTQHIQSPQNSISNFILAKITSRTPPSLKIMQGNSLSMCLPFTKIAINDHYYFLLCAQNLVESSFLATFHLNDIIISHITFDPRSQLFPIFATFHAADLSSPTQTSIIPIILASICWRIPVQSLLYPAQSPTGKKLESSSLVFPSKLI